MTWCAFKGCFKKEMEIFRDTQFLAFEWIKCCSKGRKLLRWENWVCNPANIVSSCIALASRQLVDKIFAFLRFKKKLPSLIDISCNWCYDGY